MMYSDDFEDDEVDISVNQLLSWDVLYRPMCAAKYHARAIRTRLVVSEKAKAMRRVRSSW